jgi:hypothetical protein
MTDWEPTDTAVDSAVQAARDALVKAARSDGHVVEAGLGAVTAATEADAGVHIAILEATSLLVRAAAMAHGVDVGLKAVQDAAASIEGARAPSDSDLDRSEVTIRRTSTGWRVEGSFPTLPTDTVEELGHALVLADLLAEGTVTGPRPPRPAGELDEVARLRASVRQLEYALSARVIVEQAIGVLSERWRVAPRDAFEQLRRVTRSHGVRIHDLARLVIDSSIDPDVPLPDELVKPAVAGMPSTEPPDPRRHPDDGRRRRRRRVQHDEPAAAGEPEASYASDR